VQRFPAAHRQFLEALPWTRRIGPYVFVHCGLEPGPLEPQLEELAARDMSPYPSHSGYMPAPLRDKRLTKVSDPDWSATVVSGHVKHRDRGNFAATHRISFHSGTCRGHELHAAVLPPSREGPVNFFTVGQGGW
jgi:hypothetical protein